MAALRMDGQRSSRQPDTIFECDFCASRHSARVISYNWFGYPICPVCEYEHGPGGGDVGFSTW